MSPPFYTLGLIGYPLEHSLSPQIHGAALHALGISGEYQLYPIPPDHQRDSQLPYPSPSDSSFRGGGEGQPTFNGLLDQIRTGKIHGLNVTIPHKQHVIPNLDDLTPAAEAIGAVNTIFMRGNKLTGDNTDAAGFWGDLQQLVNPATADNIEPTTKFALVLGAGGSARAVVYALLTHGYQVTIAARRVEQAQILCDQFSIISDQISVASLTQSSIVDFQYPISLLVNSTPVGMHPHINASPWPIEIPLPKDTAVYDLVYNPRETLLFKYARENGHPAMTGLGMLIEQAALAFKRWTGLEAPRQVMRQAVE